MTPENWLFILTFSRGGSRLAFVVHVADAIAMMSGVCTGLDGLQYDLDRKALVQLDIQEDDMSKIMQQMITSGQEITEEI